MSMSWRLASRLSVVTLALLVVLIIALWGLRNEVGSSAATNPSSSQSGLKGTDLGSQPAPDFRLTDQFGKQISLALFRGKPVVLTFLYTHCPDVCPLTAEKLHMTVQALGKDVSRVAIIAISMDPKGDTRAAVTNFSQVHKMENAWHYLIGAHDELAPVWASYSVDAQAATSSGTVTHTSAVYVIDKEGRERIFFSNDFLPAQLTSDLKVLLAE